MKALVVTALLFAAPAALAAEADHPARVLHLMRLIDRSHAKAELIEAGAGASGAVLLAIARDRDLPVYPRLRAAGALGLFDAREAKAGLRSLLDDATLEEREVKIQALAALVFLDGAKTLDRLEALSGHADPELRAAAVRNLARLDGARAKLILEARAKSEPVGWIRELAARGLGEAPESLD